jgi:hypothetical protein
LFLFVTYLLVQYKDKSFKIQPQAKEKKRPLPLQKKSPPKENNNNTKQEKNPYT